ncbi:MAG TPA: ABC transporter permease, partial [Vicinamibacterales bacterium]|nr:ABC transporter permease [Vicinamibacterales bacterium]
GGASEDEATRLALADFREGNLLAQYLAPLQQAQTPIPVTPGVATGHVLRGAWLDLRYAARMLRKQPAFTVAAVLTLALGIGANTATFAVLNSVLLEPLPYPDAGDLVAVWNRAPGAPGLADVTGGLRLAPSMYVTYAEGNRTFEHIGIWSPRPAAVTGVGEPEQVRSIGVSDGTLPALGVPPQLGRWFSAADQTPGGPLTVMLGHGYWQRRFGGDRNVLGRIITVEAVPHQIIGVMPHGFRVVDADADIFVPLRLERSRLVRNAFAFLGVARLKPGATIAAANADLARMFPAWLNGWPGGSTEFYESMRITPDIRPLKQEVVGGVTRILWVVAGTIGIVLLIACANVTNLLLVRAEGRQQEVAVRAALGAGSWRLIRELLLESVLLALLGGVVGIGLALAALRLLVSFGPVGLPRLGDIALDARALTFALLVSLGAGVLLGVAPALKYPRRRIAAALHGIGRTVGISRERHRIQNALVVAQVALALVLLVGSGLMIRTFQALRAVEPGFTSPRQLQIMRIAIPTATVAEPERVARLQRDILDSLGAIPGAVSVGYVSSMPMDGLATDWDAITVEGQPPRAPGDPPGPLRRLKYLSPGLLAASGTRLVAGRDLTWTEVDDGRPMVLVSENLAREVWGSPAGALGKRIRLNPRAPWSDVIGVAQDVRDNGVDTEAPAIVYFPPLRNPGTPGASVVRAATFVVRSPQAGTAAFLRQVQQAVWANNPTLPVGATQTMQDVYERSLARPTFTLLMLGLAGSVALALGVIGIYGLISYTVTQRRREIGIRLALGAQRAEVRRRFVRHGVVLTSVGVALGVVAAVAVTRLMTSLLFEVSPLDPLTYVAVAVLLVMAAALASYVPARRASAVQPVEALAAD